MYYRIQGVLLMESVNSMEKLSLLEKKISGLIKLVQAEKAKAIQLQEEKTELLLKVEMLENAILKGSQNLEELNQEGVLTRMVVDELINNIDKLVQQEPLG